MRAGDFLRANGQLSRSGGNQTADNSEQRRLAAPRRADDGEKLARLNVERNVVDGRHQLRAIVSIAENFTDVAERQDGHEIVSARAIKGGLK